MRETVFTSEAPKAVGPYSQAIRQGSLVFCSGQVGLDPASGALVPGGVEAQTRRALENLAAVLDAAGPGLKGVVKTTVFLASIDDFPAMNSVYAEFFGDSPPARSTFAVQALPLGALVEIEALASD